MGGKHGTALGYLVGKQTSISKLEEKVYICLKLRAEFLNLWNMLEASYLAMVMKGVDK